MFCSSAIAANLTDWNKKLKKKIINDVQVVRLKYLCSIFNKGNSIYSSVSVKMSCIEAVLLSLLYMFCFAFPQKENSMCVFDHA